MPIPPSLKLRHLEAFLDVVRHGNISAAARARNVSQPALSKTISDLEALMSVRLFDRAGRRTALTTAGENFRSSALAAMRNLEAAVRVTSGQAAGGQVKVGVLPTVAGSFFPAVALEFSEGYTDAVVTTVTGPNSSLIRMLRSGKIDLMVGRMPLARDMPSLAFEFLYEEPIVLVCRPDHPAGEWSAHNALETYPLILPNSCAIVRQNVNQYLSTLGLAAVKPKFETVALPVALALLEQSDLLWFISRGVVERELRTGLLTSIALNSDYMVGAIGLTRKFTFDADSPADRLARLLHRHAQRLTASG
jgi:LysR family pca operon transcriptional activator